VLIRCPQLRCTSAHLPTPLLQIDIEQCSSREAAQIDAFGLWLRKGQSVKALRAELKPLLPLQMTVRNAAVTAARKLQVPDPAETPSGRYSDSPQAVLQQLQKDAMTVQAGADSVHRQLLILQLQARHWRGAAAAEDTAERDKEQLAVRAVHRLHDEV
jgi:hypothetical protein